jgi:predicted  nucleic acid-binding Zn-ribbon protein
MTIEQESRVKTLRELTIEMNEAYERLTKINDEIESGADRRGTRVERMTEFSEAHDAMQAAVARHFAGFHDPNIPLE